MNIGPLSSAQLEAFSAVARFLSFSKAADELGITQPALSKRIQLLEDAIGVSVFVRSRTGVSLTEAGHEVLLYCRTKAAMESELLAKFSEAKSGELAGAIRIAGPSSLMRPIVFPALAALIRDNPRVEVELYVRETVDLLPMLLHAEVDFILCDTEIVRAGLEKENLGYETIVLIESSKHQSRSDVYLDAHPKDMFTQVYFSHRSEKASFRRAFLQDEYGIIDGVALGLGRAIVHQHMIPKQLSVRIVPSFKPIRSPVVLHYQAQPVYTRLHREIRKVLNRNFSSHLGG
jgi:DNA-binding transcriptional LysR family regulator